LRTSQSTVTGNECRGIIPGGEQFMVEGGGGHQACGVTAGNRALGRQVESVVGLGRTVIAKSKEHWDPF